MDPGQVTPRLTLNLGARYQLVLPLLDKRDRMGIFDTWTDPANPRLIYAASEGKDRYNRAMFATDKNNIMPRIGFAYKLTGRMVIRAGYGIFVPNNKFEIGTAGRNILRQRSFFNRGPCRSRSDRISEPRPAGSGAAVHQGRLSWALQVTPVEQGLRGGQALGP